MLRFGNATLLAIFVLLAGSVRLQATNPDLLFIGLPSFAPAPVTTLPTALADVNHDGKADLVSAANLTQVAVQLGAGNGTFGGATLLNAGNYTQGVLVAEFNNDAHPDIIVASINDKTVSVFLGNGDGTFQNQIVTNIGLVATSIAVSDFDKDGKLDIIATGYPASPLEGYITTARGNGDGSFSNVTTFVVSPRTAQTATRCVAVADLNGDTWPDLVVSNPNGYLLTSFLNNQNGTFTLKKEMGVNANVGRLVLADFNGDSKADVAFVRGNDSTYGNTGAGNDVGVAMGNGDGTFGTLVLQGGAFETMQGIALYNAGQAADTFTPSNAQLVAADMDGDGTLDLTLFSQSASQGIGYVATLRGAGNGGFASGNRTPASYGGRWISVAELNGDGSADFVLTELNSAQTFVSGVVAPAFTSANGVTFTSTSSNSFTVTATGNPPPTFSATGTLPSGVTFSAAGLLSGVPAAGTEGVYPLVITASNPQGQMATQNFTLTVSRADLAVTTLTDEDNGSPDPGLGTGRSLREAVNYAKTLAGPQTITFAPGLAGGTINFTINGNTGSLSGFGPTALMITGDITIQGPSGGLTIQRGIAGPLRLFFVSSPAMLTLNDLTLANGSTDSGGAVFTQGTVRANRCTVSGNQASNSGGAIFSGTGVVTLTGCTFSGNTAALSGGALLTGNNASITNCTFAGNQAVFAGSAIQSSQTLNLTNVTIAENAITNSSGAGGALNVSGTATAINTIVAKNTKTNNIFGSDVVGTLHASSHHNLLGSGGNGGLAHGVNGNLVMNLGSQAQLGPLANNGGPTRTMALLSTSPAINSGATVAGLTTDQRGNPRTIGSAPDIGASEDLTGNDDPDGDSLANRDEYNFSNPQALDSDGDGFNDATEKLAGTTAVDASSVPPTTRIERVVGFGAARGLDLTGTFPYALNIGVPGAAGQAGDAIFGADTGVSIAAGEQIADWTLREFGNAVGDNVLETVYRSIRWSNFLAADPNLRSLRVDLPHLIPGRTYKLQLLFSESADYNRRFDVLVEGALVADDFNISAAQGIPVRTSAASAIVHQFTAADNTLNIVLDGSNISVPVVDRNPLLNGLTVEDISAAPPLITPSGNTAYESTVQVSIVNNAPGTTIRYTTDGTVPTPSTGTIYSGPFSLTNSATVRAIAYGNGFAASQVVSNSYTVLQSLPFWRNLHGLPADGSQDLANPSGDGISNLAKYAFNLAPTAGDLNAPNYRILTQNGTAGLPLIARDAQGRLQITFVRRKAATNPGITYTVETGDVLASLQLLSLSGATIESIDATWERVRVTDPIITPARFGRVRVTE